MLKNQIITIFRQLKRNRSYTLINVLGLSVSMAATLTIAHFVQFHRSFDQYHQDADRIFRVENQNGNSTSDLTQGARIAGLYGPTLFEESPLVENYARIYSINYQNNSLIIQKQEEAVVAEETKTYAVDTGFFQLFDMIFLAGDAKRFDEPNTMIMTRKSLTRFGMQPIEVIGQKVQLSGNTNNATYEVIAVLEDVPSNSHFQFNNLISFSSLDQMNIQYKSWANYSYYTYLKLRGGFDQQVILKDLSRLYDTHSRSLIEPYGYMVSDFHLVQLSDIHIKSIEGEELAPLMSETVLNTLTIVGIVIILIAWINYYNLSVVKTLERLKELGIRKVMGAGNRQIAAILCLESVLLNVFSFFMALTILQASQSLMLRMTGLPLDLLSALDLIGWGILLVIGGASAVGIYPMLLMRKHQSATRLMAGTKERNFSRSSTRSVLVTFQFMVTFILMAAAYVIYDQLYFMKNADVGFEKSNIMVIESPPGNLNYNDNRTDIESYNTFKSELRTHPGVKAVSNAGEIPGIPISWVGNIRKLNADVSQSVETRFLTMGVEFVDFMEMEQVAGTPLSNSDSPWSTGAVLVNEQLVRQLGFQTNEEAIGQKLDGFYSSNPVYIKGVLRNHHHMSLHEAFDPVMYVQ